MNSSILRLIACGLMLADHLGSLFFPEDPVLRLLGRMAFPIFAFLVAQGCRWTRSPQRYVARLALLAAGSQIPFLLAFPDGYTGGNVVLTLLAGGVACLAPPARKSLVLICMALVSEFCRFDYGAAGVLAVFVFWWVGERMEHRIAAFLIVGLLTAGRHGILAVAIGRSFQNDFVAQAFSFLAVWVALVYDNSVGRKWRGFFYLFYPVHLIVLAAGAALLGQRIWP